MSRKHVLQPYKVITDGSMAGNLTSAVTNTQQLDRIKYSTEWSGSPVGTVTIQESSDGVNWYDLDIIPAIAVSGASGHDDIYLQNVSIKFTRLVYTRTSGTGTFQATIEGASVGA